MSAPKSARRATRRGPYQEPGSIEAAVALPITGRTPLRRHMLASRNLPEQALEFFQHLQVLFGRKGR